MIICPNCGTDVVMTLGNYIGHSNYADGRGVCTNCGLIGVGQQETYRWFWEVPFTEKKENDDGH